MTAIFYSFETLLTYLKSILAALTVMTVIAESVACETADPKFASSRLTSANGR